MDKNLQQKYKILKPLEPDELNTEKIEFIQNLQFIGIQYKINTINLKYNNDDPNNDCKKILIVGKKCSSIGFNEQTHNFSSKFEFKYRRLALILNDTKLIEMFEKLDEFVISSSIVNRDNWFNSPYTIGKCIEKFKPSLKRHENGYMILCNLDNKFVCKNEKKEFVDEKDLSTILKNKTMDVLFEIKSVKINEYEYYLRINILQCNILSLE
jgi:hypothetical protein